MKKAITADPSIKLVFLCSPGNPTGTLISLSSIREILEYEDFKGIVIVDEAYIDFADEEASAVSLIKEYANLCVTQTLSKSFGIAAIRYVFTDSATIARMLTCHLEQVRDCVCPPCACPDPHEHQGAV